jgi:hypothetical protein
MLVCSRMKRTTTPRNTPKSALCPRLRAAEASGLTAPIRAAHTATGIGPPTQARAIARYVMALVSRAAIKRIEITSMAATFATFPFVFFLCISYRLPLHILWGVDSTTRKRLDVVDHIAWTGSVRLSGCRTWVFVLEFTPGSCVAMDASVCITLTRLALG